MKKPILYLLAAAVSLLTACSNDDPRDVITPDTGVITPTLTDWTPQPLKSVAPANVSKANGFAFTLFKKTMETGEDNLCLSPVSVLSTFAMAANGDSGETRDEVLSLLGYAPDELSSLNLYCNALMTESTSLNGGTECAFANSLWYHPGLTPCEPFVARLHTIFNASVFDTWLGDERGMNMVNDYISTATHGLISEFLKSPLKEVKLALINATYFKGAWKVEFDKALTSTKDFTNLNGTVSQTEFMYREDSIEYAETESLRSVRLPYLGDRYTMTLIQPCGTNDFSSMLTNLSHDNIRILDDLYTPRTISLYLPRFETDINIDLLDQVKAMGLNLACTSGFDSICNDDTLLITVLKHGVKLIVNEEGTEAAAATIMGMDNCAGGDWISFDHPFIYLIRDTVSNTVLFIGAVTKF